jgi:hypothetical protein
MRRMVSRAGGGGSLFYLCVFILAVTKGENVPGKDQSYCSAFLVSAFHNSHIERLWHRAR